MLTLKEDTVHVSIHGLSDEVEVLVDHFKFRPDGYFYAPSYMEWRATKGESGWNGWMHPVKQIGRKSAIALRGRKQEILNVCGHYGFDVNTDGLLESPFDHLTLSDIPPDIIAGSFQLDDSQRRCILSWLRSGIGINKVTVSGGKTAMFAGAAAMIKQRFTKARLLYVTPSERLVKQVVKELPKMLPDMDISQYGGGKSNRDGKDIVVCTVAMLNRNFALLKRDDWLDSFNGVLYDEVHHATSPSSEKLMTNMRAYFRFGASDTLKELNTTKYNLLSGLFGQVFNRIEAAPLIKVGRIAQPLIYLVDIQEWNNRFELLDHTVSPETVAHVLMEGEWVKGTYKGPVHALDEDGDVIMKQRKIVEDGEVIKEKYAVIETGQHRIEINGTVQEVDSRWCLVNRVYDRAIIQFKERNQMVAAWSKHYSDQGHPTLVVCTRTLHIYILEALLKQTLDPRMVRILFSTHSAAERDETFEWLRVTPGAVLITSLVKEGVSINEIRAVVVADYMADWESVNQVIGRAIREKKDGLNRAEITMFIDRQHPTYRRTGIRLFKQLEKIKGYKFYHPCSGPESIKTALEYGAAA